MKITVTENGFIRTFEKMGRGNQFSYDGLIALYNYFEDIDENMELDIISICCEYTEYATLEALKIDYPDIKNMDDLEDCTTVISINDNSFIIQNF